MNPKKIYFIRHGESEANVDPFARSTNVLTEKGLQQSKILAERFKNITADILIATSKTRAQQTAHEISLVKNIPIIENDLFLEREGELESFNNSRERVQKAATYLENLKEEKIAVVTHGDFLKLLVAYLIFKDALTEELAVMFIKATAAENTGITLCKFNPGTKAWKLITFNDQSHLG